MASSSRMFHSSSADTSFNYQGWHKHPSVGSTFSYHSAVNEKQPMVKHVLESPPTGLQLRTSRVMCPKADREEQSITISWDEDYDEYNLHTTSHQVNTRSQHVQNIEAVEHNDLFGLHCDETTPAYSWDVASVSRLLNAPSPGEKRDMEEDVAVDF